FRRGAPGAAHWHSGSLRAGAGHLGIPGVGAARHRRAGGTANHLQHAVALVPAGGWLWHRCNGAGRASVGAQRIAEGAAAARVATTWAVIWMSAIAVLLIIFAPQVVALFTSDAAVIAAGVPGLRVLALTQPFWAVLFVQAGALRGTGNTRFPLLVTGTSIWAATGLAFALIETIGGGLPTIWAAFLVLAPVMAFLMWQRFRRTVAEF